MKRYTVGIDLGTSNTVLAYAEAGVAAGGRRSRRSASSRSISW